MITLVSGHGSDFLLISMKEGGVSLTVSMESGQLDTAIKVRKYIIKIGICPSYFCLYL
jgi:hypothetical protein